MSTAALADRRGTLLGHLKPASCCQAWPAVPAQLRAARMLCSTGLCLPVYNISPVCDANPRTTHQLRPQGGRFGGAAPCRRGLVLRGRQRRGLRLFRGRQPVPEGRRLRPVPRRGVAGRIAICGGLHRRAYSMYTSYHDKYCFHLRRKYLCRPHHPIDRVQLSQCRAQSVTVPSACR
jgi:hypothetical protein